ncbi:MAG: uracil phosphoribosyltransferase, partial [Zoogloea sp.]|nr:uracil phosphoribosyltransferase [Zoogloea sp.]
MTAPVTVIDHPLLQHKLSMARSADTTTDNFRRLVR